MLSVYDGYVVFDKGALRRTTNAELGAFIRANGLQVEIPLRIHQNNYRNNIETISADPRVSISPSMIIEITIEIY